MPDVPSLSLALIGLYFFLRWIDSEKSVSLFAAATVISLALLIKLPSAIIGAPLLFLVWQKWRCNFVRQPLLWLFATITILPSIAWYWHAHQSSEKFYPHHFFGAGGILIEKFSWYWKIVRLTAISSLTPILSVFALAGLFVAPRGKYARVFHWWLAATILFIIVVGYGNRHRWYQLQLVPIAAGIADGVCSCTGSN